MVIKNDFVLIIADGWGENKFYQIGRVISIDNKNYYLVKFADGVIKRYLKNDFKKLKFEED